MLEGLQALEPVLLSTPSYVDFCSHELMYGVDFKRHEIMYPPSDPFRRYEGWQTWSKIGWEEKYFHCPSVAGYLVGKGFGI